MIDYVDLFDTKNLNDSSGFSPKRCATSSLGSCSFVGEALKKERKKQINKFSNSNESGTHRPFLALRTAEVIPKGNVQLESAETRRGR